MSTSELHLKGPFGDKCVLDKEFNHQRINSHFRAGDIQLASQQWALRSRTMAQFVRNLAEKAPALVNASVTYSKP